MKFEEQNVYNMKKKRMANMTRHLQSSCRQNIAVLDNVQNNFMFKVAQSRIIVVIIRNHFAKLLPINILAILR